VQPTVRPTLRACAFFVKALLFDHRADIPSEETDEVRAVRSGRHLESQGWAVSGFQSDPEDPCPGHGKCGRGGLLGVWSQPRSCSSRRWHENILGPATAVVYSGSVWTDTETGEVQAKRHLHWRLAVPAHGAEALGKLKLARELACRIVGADPSNISTVHPLRWPGSWHRKGDPVLCRMEACNPDLEIDLDNALAQLKEACPADLVPKLNSGAYPGTDIDTRVTGILDGTNYHDNIVGLVAYLVIAGTHGGAAVNLARALMNASQGARDSRWQTRYDDIPRAVFTAEQKFRRPAEPGGEIIEGNYTVIAGVIEKAKQLDAEQTEPPPAPAEPKAPQPLEADREAPLLPFTYNVPGVLGEIIDWTISTARRPNRVVALGVALTVTGTLIGRRVAGPTRSGTHLYAVAVGTTAHGKQHGINAANLLMHAAGASAHIGAGEYFSLPGVFNMLWEHPVSLCLQDEFGKFLQGVTDNNAKGWEKSVSRILRILWGISFGSLAGVQWAHEKKEAIWCPALSAMGSQPQMSSMPPFRTTASAMVSSTGC
jgi:hypothetical protein